MPVVTPRTSRMKPLRLTIAIALLVAHTALAQRQVGLNPAANTNLELAGQNPAAMSFQPSRLVLRSEILHAGFIPNRALGLQEHRLLLTLPYTLPSDFAFGIEARSFRAQIFSELEINLLLSRKIFQQFAVGMKLGYASRAFDRSQFTRVDLNDPLLQGEGLRRATPNLGASLLGQLGAITAAASVDYLNEPDIGYSSKAILPRFIALGVAYNLGGIAPSLSWSHDGAQPQLGFELSARISPLALTRVSYERSGTIRLETQLQLQRNAKLAYGVNWSSGAISAAASGTHALLYEHVLGREPEIGAPLLVLSTNRMNLTHATHEYVAASNINLAQLEATHGMSEEFVAPHTQLGNLAIVPLLHEENSEEVFRALSRHTVIALQENNLHEVALRIAPGASRNARAFERILRQDLNGRTARVLLGYHKPREAVSLQAFRARNGKVQTATALSHENLLINLVLPGRRRHVTAWRLDIMAPNATTIKSFHGTQTLPSTLSWNWRNAEDELVAAGEYRCKLAVTSKAGKKYSSAAEILITRTQRRVTIRLQQAPATFESHRARTEASVK